MAGRKKDGRRGAAALSLFGTGATFLLTLPAPADAAAFYLQEQSVRGWGRANSGEVADQGPASLWWNPAAIGGAEESSAAFGGTLFLPSGEISDRGTLIDRPGLPPAPVGGAPLMKDPVRPGLLPASAFALRVSDRLTLGLNIASPYSFTTQYDPDGWQRYSAIRTRLTTFDFQPTVAYMASDWLSLGAGVNIEFADAFLGNALPNLAAGSADGRLRLKGRGWDLGWSAGVQLRPSDRLSIGLAYKSAVEHKLSGTAEIVGLSGPLAPRNLASDIVVRFDTPWQLIMGARAGVGQRLTLNAQAVHYGWSRFDQIGLGAPISAPIVQNYKNSWSFAFGADAEASERLTIRAGIQFDGTPTRDASRDPRVPDGDRINYNAGASFRIGRRITLDAAAAYTDFEETPIERDERFYAGTAAQTDVISTGRSARQRALVLSLGGRMRF